MTSPMAAEPTNWTVAHRAGRLDASSKPARVAAERGATEQDTVVAAQLRGQHEAEGGCLAGHDLEPEQLDVLFLRP